MRHAQKALALLPRYAYNGIIVIGGIAEIIAQIDLVIRISEVVYPTCSVGIYIHYVGIQEVPRPRQRSVDGFTMYVSVIVNISRVLAYHHHLVGIYGHIGVQVALSGFSLLRRKAAVV